MYNIAFRVDGGVKIGLGHLMRCISLAIALDELNVNVYFICCLTKRSLVSHELTKS